MPLKKNWCRLKEQLNKSFTERVAVNIGMIARRATKVVVCAFTCSDAKERNKVSADFAATRMGRSFASDLFCQAPSEGRPEALVEGLAKRDWAASGCNDRAILNLGHQHPASRSHLPSEDTAPLFAVAPFASSPFAHLIPQSSVAPARICSTVPSLKVSLNLQYQCLIF